MKKSSCALLTVLVLLVFSIMPVCAREYSTADYEVCYELFEACGTKETYRLTMESTCDEMLKTYSKMGIPDTEKLGPVVKEFLNKYISYESVKQELAKIYLDNFTIKEIKALIAFYQTPLGRKVAEKTPQLTIDGMRIGSKQVLEHQNELQQMLIKALR